MKRQNRDYVSWRTMAVLAVLIVGGFAFLMMRTSNRLDTLQAEDSDLLNEVQIMTQEYDSLKRQLARVGSDGYVENAARDDEYQMIKRGEIIFSFPSIQVLEGYTEEEFLILLEEMR